MNDSLKKIAGDAEGLADEVRQLIGTCRDYDLLRLLKKLDAEIMDMRHNIQLAIDVAQVNQVTKTSKSI